MYSTFEYEYVVVERYEEVKHDYTPCYNESCRDMLRLLLNPTDHLRKFVLKPSDSRVVGFVEVKKGEEVKKEMDLESVIYSLQWAEKPFTVITDRDIHLSQNNSMKLLKIRYSHASISTKLYDGKNWFVDSFELVNELKAILALQYCQTVVSSNEYLLQMKHLI
jgi:hypothetical protein